MKFKRLYIALAACAMFSSVVKADIMSVSRDSLYTISFLDNSFVSANARYNVIVRVEGEEDELSSDDVIFPIDRTNFQNLTFTAAGGTIVSDVMVVPGPAAIATVTSNGDPGSYTAGFDTPISTDPSMSWIVSGTSGGLRTLTFVNGGGSGLVDPGFPFNIDVMLPGDWSSSGTGAGMHTFGGINPAWTIDKNFVFNGATTEFHAFNGSYDPTAPSPNLNFTLYGSAASTVPEPGSFVLLGGGLFGLLMLKLLSRYSRLRQRLSVR